MMSLLLSIIIFFSLFALEILYFKIADRYHIIDKPNLRSSHTAVTIRGGGIIFSVAALLFFFLNDFQYPFFILGLTAIALISFLDDIHTLNNKIRLSVHLLSVLLLFYQWNLYELPWYWLIIGLIAVIGTINAYNFMDGINGITGGYSLITILTLYYINNNVVEFTANNLLIIITLSILVFNFFNFRAKAKCFAGDVGSVSIAFVIIFLIGLLIITSANFTYILLLLIYGMDTATTVFFRKIRKENIFEAHRSHFYQYLANQLKWNHLLVSLLYMFLQLAINAVLIFVIKDSLIFAAVLLGVLVIFFLATRFAVEGKKYLLEPRV